MNDDKFLSQGMTEAKPKILAVNRRHYPAQATVLGHIGFRMGDTIIDQSENPPPTLCVLVEGDIGDYAAYVGHGEPEWVARHGDKISFEEALCHFPVGLQKNLYRS